jgi:hypothetical protein
MEGHYNNVTENIVFDFTEKVINNFVHTLNYFRVDITDISFLTKTL